MLLADPSRLWFLSARLYEKGWRRTSRLIKAYNFLVFRAVLPPEAKLLGPVVLGHYGMNVVVHPNVSIGRGVKLWHNVTLSVTDSPGSTSRLELLDDIEIGTGAVIVTREKTSLRICSHVRIGSNAVVTRDIEVEGTYLGSPAKRLNR